MAKVDPASWIVAALGAPAAIAAAFKLGSGFPAWKEKRRNRRLEAAKQLLREHDIETALPGVVEGYPTIVQQLGEIKDMVSNVLQELHQHAVSDTTEFGSVRQEVAAKIKEISAEILEIKHAIADLTVTVEGLSDLRDVMKQLAEKPQ